MNDTYSSHNAETVLAPPLSTWLLELATLPLLLTCWSKEVAKQWKLLWITMGNLHWLCVWIAKWTTGEKLPRFLEMLIAALWVWDAREICSVDVSNSFLHHLQQTPADLSFPLPLLPYSPSSPTMEDLALSLSDEQLLGLKGSLGNLSSAKSPKKARQKSELKVQMLLYFDSRRQNSGICRLLIRGVMYDCIAVWPWDKLACC